MPAPQRRAASAPASTSLEAFGEVSHAVESGAGLPEVARATSRALNAGVAVIDAASSVLAVACASPEDERAVLSQGEGTDSVDLRVADTDVGQLRFRARRVPPDPALVRMVATLIALEVERSRGPERASDEAIATFLSDLLDRRVTDRDNIVARAKELGADIGDGASVLIARARPQSPEAGDWRARVMKVAQRGARGLTRGMLAAHVELAAAHAGAANGQGGRGRAADPEGELVLLVPGPDAELARRVATAVLRELESGLSGYALAVSASRPAGDPVDIHRAGSEALLAANVAEAQGETLLAFEETGAYRLLLPAMSEEPAELHRFQEETVAPLLAYDEQYQTELVRTLESFLDADGSVAKTAERLFTHRHTIRYRLERVRELTGLDVSSTDGRERLSLGLKAMRVLGIAPRRGPATEPGAEAGRVPREESDR